MSLGVTLHCLAGPKNRSSGTSGIFVRQNGQTVEISMEEWNEKHPGQEPVVFTAQADDSDEVFSANITHNLNAMAEEAGIYQHLWAPEEIDITTAGQLIEPLRQGLAQSDPSRFQKHNPGNGWGSYADFLPWLRRYLAACEEFPNATISVSR